MKKGEEKCKKIMDFLGYEIYVDSRNFTTVKDGVQRYYGSLYQLFYKINLEVNQRSIKETKLDNIVKTLQGNEENFLFNLKETLGKLTFVEPEEIINK